MFAGTECEQVQVKSLGFVVGFASKRSICKGCVFLAPAAGISASGYGVGSGHGSGWELRPWVGGRWGCSTGNVLERLGRGNSDLNLAAAHQPPGSHVVPQVSFPCLPKRGLQTVFSFLYVAYLFTVMFLACVFIHSLSHTPLKKMSSHCSNQCLWNGCIIPNDTMSRLNTFLNIPWNDVRKQWFHVPL